MRDYFAARAMQSLALTLLPAEFFVPEAIAPALLRVDAAAGFAYLIADAMLKARPE